MPLAWGFESPPAQEIGNRVFILGFNFLCGSKPNNWLAWGTRRAERCFCLSYVVGKGKNREPRPWSIFRQENDVRASQVVPPAQEIGNRVFILGFNFLCGSKPNNLLYLSFIGFCIKNKPMKIMKSPIIS